MNNCPIIIGGFYRSGTSLLRRLLDAHTAIHCSAEVKFMKDWHGDFLNDSLAHARYFSSLKTLELPAELALQIHGEAYIKTRQAAALLRGKIRWADKNPENVLYLHAWQKILPNGFKFVHVVRDPLDSLASLQEIGFYKTLPRGIAKRAKAYQVFLAAGETYERANPRTSYRINYEDLVSQPEASLKNLMIFLGESYEPSQLKGINSAERGQGLEDPKSSQSATVHADSVGRGSYDLWWWQRKKIRAILNLS